MAEILELPQPTYRRTDRLRVLVVAESFLPQINGVTNSVRRVLEHLEAEGHEAELVAPTGPATYAGFPVTRARGASLPFYKDFRIGLETRRRLRSVMVRFRPDVVHIASPATLGYQAAKAAGELGIPTVAIYQTDLVGFAERYDIPGGVRAMAALTRKIHTRVDRTLAPSSASLRQLEQLEIPGTALWPRGVDLRAFHPGHRSHQLRHEIAPDDRLLVGYIGRLAPEKELELLTHLADDPRYALVMVGGGPEEQRLRTLLPGARFLGVLHGEELSRAYASLDVFVHTGRHETYCQSAQEALSSGVPVVAPRAGGPIDVVADGEAGFLYEPGNGADLAAYVDKLASDPLLRRRMGLAARRSVAGRSWESVNARLVEHYRDAVGEQVSQRRLAG
jgi:phosphatidylinositol alpha 1,6-mannosyltransferase